MLYSTWVIIMNYSLTDAFNQFVSQIQFSINSFLAVFTIILTVIVAIGAYFSYTVATKAAKTGVEKAAKDLDQQNKLLKRIEDVEKDQESVHNYIADFGMRLFQAPMSGNNISNTEKIYYGKASGYLYISGTFIPHGIQEIACLPVGFRPKECVNVVAVSCSSNAQYGTIQIMPSGSIVTNILESDVLYVFQAFIPPDD